jgi:hypothetical protein
MPPTIPNLLKANEVKNNEYYPLITTVSGNGYDGITVMPRWATNIYYNASQLYKITDPFVNRPSVILPVAQLQNGLPLRLDPVILTRSLLWRRIPIPAICSASITIRSCSIKPI